ncbi:hypothetical protein GCM10011581_25580 [Saccharopolyspora subtropica]|uniref:HTH tetR-type domain-containing protein n=1 Tax=Saccharopolyspora thermophila TaxID=89367 RepID=A0A917JWK2_9PSEU|nr:TetR/AcrR family transcriptional regulator [Saccharopolyspora subtropica]GGI87371.1 hypothetical protein GCM10011581_25580 [Saccharopolyspora subtropica]
MSKSRAAAEAPSGGGRETARRARTRERLLDAAYRQFCQHGINGASIEAITDDAGFTRGAFYSNFDSKEELFLALIERENRTRLETLRERFGEAIAPLARVEGKPGPDVLEEVLADIIASQPMDQQWCLLHSEFLLLAMRNPQVAPRFLESARAFHQQLADLLDTALESVGLRFVVDTVDLTQMVVNQAEAAIQEAILSGAEDTDRAARDSIMRILPPLLHSLTELRDPPTGP